MPDPPLTLIVMSAFYNNIILGHLGIYYDNYFLQWGIPVYQGILTFSSLTISQAKTIILVQLFSMMTKEHMTGIVGIHF